MKLADAAKLLREVDDEDKKIPPPITGGGTISTSQAARILGVSVSRIRQLIGAGSLKPVIKPRKGDRDHELLAKDVRALKDTMNKGDAGKKATSSEDDDKEKNKS